MAGQPKTRAKQNRQQVDNAGTASKTGSKAVPDAIPDAVSAADDDQFPRPTRARARARRKPTGSPPSQDDNPRLASQPGKQTRALLDQVQANELAALAAELKPGLSLSLFRLLPAWCSGWLEDYSVSSSGNIGELYEHLAYTYGGHKYRVIVKNSDGRAYFESTVEISGPPRYRGRTIDRDTWEGNAGSEPRAPVQAQQSQQTNGAGLLKVVTDLFGTIIGQQRESNQAVLHAVRDMNAAQAERTNELITAVVQTRSEERTQTSFAGQLKEFLEGARALDTVKEALTDQESIKRGPEPQEDLLNMALKGAAAEFMSNVIAAKARATARRSTEKKPVDHPDAIRDPGMSAGSGKKH